MFGRVNNTIALTWMPTILKFVKESAAESAFAGWDTSRIDSAL